MASFCVDCNESFGDDAIKRHATHRATSNMWDIIYGSSPTSTLQPAGIPPRTSLSGYTDGDLAMALNARPNSHYVVCTREFYDDLVSQLTEFKTEAGIDILKAELASREVPKTSPKRDKWFVSNPETYWSDYDE